MSERFEIKIYAYVLMDSHYHLLLRTMRPNLSKSMQWLGTRYTRRFNLRNLQSGHLFQGRFKSIIVENDAYLLKLSCYIHELGSNLYMNWGHMNWGQTLIIIIKLDNSKWAQGRILIINYWQYRKIILLLFDAQ